MKKATNTKPNFKLTDEDKNILLSMGYLEEDFDQIERATNIGTFTIGKRIKGTKEYKEHKINFNKAIELVGKEQFLASIGRASFHWTTTDSLKECSEKEFWGYSDEYVGYDFSKLFR